MPWTITFHHSNEPKPVAIFSGLPDQVGEKILAFIVPVVRAAEKAAQAKRAADPYRHALDALLEVVTTTKKGRRS